MATRTNPFKPILKQIPKPFRNRYFLVLILFIGWLVFFDRHNVWTQIKLQQSLNKLKEDKAFYQDKIEEVQQDRLDIELNPEKFAREKYYMNKKNEDVFLMIREEEQ